MGRRGRRGGDLRIQVDTMTKKGGEVEKRDQKTSTPRHRKKQISLITGNKKKEGRKKRRIKKGGGKWDSRA